MLRVLMAYSGAVLVTFLLGSALATHIILGNVQDLGPSVSMAMRWETTVHDIGGLSSSYLPLISIAFIIGLLVATGLIRWFPSQRTALYMLAGAVAIVTLHMAMKAALGLTGIAATRTFIGLLSQGLAGAIGGYVYCRIHSFKNG